MQFDAPYFERLRGFINQKDNVRYNISDLSETPDKMIFHLKFYIDKKRHEDTFGIPNEDMEIELNADYTGFRVFEFFDSQLKRTERIKQLWEDAKKWSKPVIKVDPVPVVVTTTPEPAKATPKK